MTKGGTTKIFSDSNAQIDIKNTTLEQNKNIKQNNPNNSNGNKNYLQSTTRNIFALQNNSENYKRIPLEKYSNHNRSSSIIQSGQNFISPKYNTNKFPGHFRSISNLNENAKYKENYIHRVNNLKETLDPENNNNNSNLYESPSKNNSFKYYEIPRINNSKITENYRINEYHNSIEKSIKYSNPDFLNENENFKIEDLVNKENDRLNLYMKNLNFLDFNRNNNNNSVRNNRNSNNVNNNTAKFNYKKLPNLIDFQSLEKMRINKVKAEGNKNMGKRYSNFD